MERIYEVILDRNIKDEVSGKLTTATLDAMSVVESSAGALARATALGVGSSKSLADEIGNYTQTGVEAAMLVGSLGVKAGLKAGAKATKSLVAKAQEKVLKSTGLVKKTKPIASSSSTAIKKPLASSSNSGRVKQNVNKWSREPKSIQDQMALDAAKRGDPMAKEVPLRDSLGDPRYKGMRKMRLKIESKEGKQSVIHYVEDPKTGKRMDFKFKKHSTE